jgi:pimeloyl-ACP methyl ester carboxylesterase
VDADLREHCLAMVRHAMEPGRNAGIAAVPDPPSVERLGDITAPLLVIAGELDQPTVRQIADMLAEQVPGARKVEIPGAAHMAHMEKAEEVRRIVRDFLVEM